MLWLLFVLFGYLSGSVLYCYYLPLWIKGLDITKDSSDKNPGAFNCISRAGAAIGIPALLFDLLKGTLPILLACNFLDVKNLTFALVLVAPCFGTRLSDFQKFQGWKGHNRYIWYFARTSSFLAACRFACGHLYFLFPCNSDISQPQPLHADLFLLRVLSVVWIRAGAVSLGCAASSCIVFLSTNFHLWVKTRLFSPSCPLAPNIFSTNRFCSDGVFVGAFLCLFGIALEVWVWYNVSARRICSVLLEWYKFMSVGVDNE